MRYVTGIQPSGIITIGNYIGAIKNLKSEIKDEDEVYVFLADLHAITINQDPNVLRENVITLVSLYIALGLDEKMNIFCQSHISEHTSLAWLLQCFTKMGELNRMTQFKDKGRGSDSASVGLFTYPTLMAADILLYNADVVPVGEDQKQHLELARDLAERVNKFYKEDIFKLPEPKISKGNSKIYSLTDPTKKMSKSDENPKSYISMLDPADVILKKFKSATTDSIGVINYDPENQPGVSNLLTIYCSFKEISMEQALEYFEGQNYGFLKQEVASSVIEVLEPIQSKYEQIRNDEKIYLDVLEKGKKEAKKISSDTINKLNKIVGYLEKC